MHAFFSLTPDVILDAVEASLGLSGQAGRRATGRAFALNSIENRVYEIELEDATSVVAKFYRPGRWTPAQILEEHKFLFALKQAEVPVVPPLELQASPVLGKSLGPTLAQSKDEIFFAVFPKMRGRSLDELSDDKLEQLGRFVARLHATGEAMGKKSARIALNVETYGHASLKFLAESGFLEPVTRGRYLQIAERICALIAPRFAQLPGQRIHGDCHLGNLLWNETGAFIVDFDDMVVGPPVQDLWMIAGGRDDYGKKQREVFLKGYRHFRDFDESTLTLIEPLRALRLIHYSAWIARRWEDPSFPRMFPHFGSERYWQEEIEALYEILNLIENPECSTY